VCNGSTCVKDLTCAKESTTPKKSARRRINNVSDMPACPMYKGALACAKGPLLYTNSMHKYESTIG